MLEDEVEVALLEERNVVSEGALLPRFQVHRMILQKLGPLQFQVQVFLTLFLQEVDLRFVLEPRLLLLHHRDRDFLHLELSLFGGGVEDGRTGILWIFAELFLLPGLDDFLEYFEEEEGVCVLVEDVALLLLELLLDPAFDDVGLLSQFALLPQDVGHRPQLLFQREDALVCLLQTLL